MAIPRRSSTPIGEQHAHANEVNELKPDVDGINAVVPIGGELPSELDRGDEEPDHQAEDQAIRQRRLQIQIDDDECHGKSDHKVRDNHAAEKKRRIDVAISEVGLEHARLLMPSELSGGMAQRTALARCVARQPEVILLDEPFGALDEVTRAAMQKLLLTLRDDLGTAAVLITHDIDEALQVADRIVLLGGAPAHCVGEWHLAYAQPREDLVEELGQLRIEILRTLQRALHTKPAAALAQSALKELVDVS